MNELYLDFILFHFNSSKCTYMCVYTHFFSAILPFASLNKIVQFFEEPSFILLDPFQLSTSYWMDILDEYE